LTRRI